ncbi:PAS domain S-box protein [uncultured Christiangramia sp.]|uniref:PAS domain S-box protein n=1 Tax=uncultured Christiangramia sp. TaxID=503836 RepID=UPI00261FF21A|nr:PAS domain S-box protein [uncultured Christiangramia sp.]
MSKTNHNPTSPGLNLKLLLISLVSALVLVILGFFMLWQRYQILVDDRQTEMSSMIDVVAQNIDQSLKYSYSAALSLALQIDEKGEIDNFELIASQLVDNNPNIDAIQIVPNGVITKVYPFEENKDAINYNILEDATRNQEALEAIESKRMFFAGPFELKQGGLAVVGRLPVFIKNDFWGFVAVIIKFDNLMHQSGIQELSGDDYQFQFSKINPVSEKEEFFLKSRPDLHESYSEVITLPDGEWRIYIIPQSLHQPFLRLIPVALLIIFFGGAVAYIIYQILKRPVIMQQRMKSQAGELAESEQRFRTIFNQAAIGMARLDTNTGIILETNKKFQQLLGYPEDYLVGKSHIDITHPDDNERNIELIEKLRNNEINQYSLQKRLLRSDGKIIWINLSVSPLWAEGEQATSQIALIEDISARMETKQLLIDNENRFRALVENSDEIILIVDTENSVRYYSPSLAKVSKYEEIDFTAHEVLHYIHPDDHDLLRQKIEYSYTKPNLPIADIILRVKNAEDHWFWVNATLTNMLEVQNVNGFVVNLRDITEKREAELNLVKSYELVMEQNKRLLNFAYIVSHNLRSHASNMQSILELYTEEDSVEEKDRYIELLQKVSGNLDQSLHDLNDVVSISTNMDISIQKINVRDMLENTLEILIPQINRKEARIRNKVPAEMEVSFNAAYMESVLLNFLTNALLYTDKSRTPEIIISGYLKNERWVLEVEDNGIGIDMDAYGDKIFGLYKTFSSRKDGRGVGLFITKNQVEAMGGSVDLESTPGEGTTFKVYFK